MSSKSGKDLYKELEKWACSGLMRKMNSQKEFIKNQEAKIAKLKEQYRIDRDYFNNLKEVMKEARNYIDGRMTCRSSGYMLSKIDNALVGVLDKKTDPPKNTADDLVQRVLTGKE